MASSNNFPWGHVALGALGGIVFFRGAAALKSDAGRAARELRRVGEIRSSERSVRKTERKDLRAKQKQRLKARLRSP